MSMCVVTPHTDGLVYPNQSVVVYIKSGQVLGCGSRVSVSGNVAFGVYTVYPGSPNKVKVSGSNISFFTAELLSISRATWWIEDVKPRMMAIYSDSVAALVNKSRKA